MKWIAVIVIILALGGGIFWWVTKSDQQRTDTAAVQSQIRGGTVEKAAESGKVVYRNDAYGFSFEYPEGYTVSSIPDTGDSFVILVQNPNGEEEFQVYAAAYDEPWPITPERIHRDLPDLVIKDPQYVVIGSGTIEALIFFGESEEFGESREVWFIHDGVLYQVTTHAELDKFIGPIMETWSF